MAAPRGSADSLRTVHSFPNPRSPLSAHLVVLRNLSNFEHSPQSSLFVDHVRTY